MVTVVSMFMTVGAVLKTPSPSSRPTRERRKSHRGQTCGWRFLQEIQPEPLGFFSLETLANRGRATPFLLPNGE